MVLENAQTEKAPRVIWKQTMEGMFGDRVKWEEIKAYSTKNRPMWCHPHAPAFNFVELRYMEGHRC